MATIDHDDWLQCHNCGKIYAKYQTKIEDKLGQFTENISNPHDIGHSVIGIGNKKKKSDIQKQHDRLLKQIDAEEDEDLKREMRAGRIIQYDSGDY